LEAARKRCSLRGDSVVRKAAVCAVALHSYLSPHPRESSLVIGDPRKKFSGNLKKAGLPPE
jgi:hypothetical protein